MATRPAFPYALPLALLIATAPVLGQQAPGSRVIHVEVPAPSLAANLVGTQSSQPAAIYLPPGYDTDTARRYPTIYLLHGIFDDSDTWLEFFELPAILDRLIITRRLPATIVVMPNAGNRYGGGYYVDSAVTGGWATYITSDLVDFVDARFRTAVHRDARALAGHSMGGFGAIHIPMEHPGVFSVAYAMSPCCLAPVEDLGFGNVSWTEAYRLESEGDLQAAIDRRDFYVVAAIGILSAFSPDTANPPFYVDFPFDLVRGEKVIDEVEWLEYVERFPVARADDRRAQLAGLRALGMDYGVGDQFPHIPAATRAFSQRLAELRVPHRLDVYQGDHRQQLKGRLETEVLPWLGRFLEDARLQ